MCEWADSPPWGWDAGQRAIERLDATRPRSDATRWSIDVAYVGSDPTSRHVRFVSGSQRTVDER
jgi:hypothetical protein